MQFIGLKLSLLTCLLASSILGTSKLAARVSPQNWGARGAQLTINSIPESPLNPPTLGDFDSISPQLWQAKDAELAINSNSPQNWGAKDFDLTSPQLLQAKDTELAINSNSPQNWGVRGAKNYENWEAGGAKLLTQSSEAEKLVQQGSQQYQSGEFEAAILTWKQALTLYQTQNNTQMEAIVSGYLGATYLALKQYESALEYLQSALTLAQATHNPILVGQVLGNLGLVYQALNQPQKAINTHQKSLEIAQENNNLEGELIASKNLGNLYRQLGNTVEALEIFKHCLEVAKKLDNQHKILQLIEEIGVIYNELHQYSLAIQSHQEQLDLSRQLGGRAAEASALGNLGINQRALGKYNAAIVSLNKALEIVQENPQSVSSIKLFINLGNVHESIGNYQVAMNYYHEALQLAQANNQPQLQANALGQLGLIHAYLGELDQATQFYQQGLKIAQNNQDQLSIGHLLTNYGSVLHSQGNLEEALNFYHKSLKIARELNHRSMEISALTNLGIVYADLGNYNQAIELQKQSLAITESIQAPRKQATALNNLAHTLYESNQLTEAETYLRTAIHILDNLRAELDDIHKVSLFDTQVLTYNLLQQVLIAQNRPDAALEVSEWGRARAFVELLVTQFSHDKSAIDAQPLTLEKVRNIAQTQKATLVEYSIIPEDDFLHRGKLKGTGAKLYIWVIQPTGEIAFRKVPLNSLEATLEELISQTRTAVGARGFSSTQEILQPGDFVRRTGEPMHWTPYEVVEVDLEAKTVTLAHPEFILPSPVPISQVYKTDTSADPQPHFHHLYQVLIEPIADLLPNDPEAKVTFIPHEGLFLVPFAALQDEDGKYLIEKHTILTAPSIQVLDSTYKRKQQIAHSAKEILIVGNPSPMPENLNHLPGSEAEAKAISQLLNVKAFIGKEATETAIRQRLADAKLIHLATHGTVNNLEPLKGAIALAPSGNHDKTNGLLTAGEILNLGHPLNAELVILSACNTGRGEITGDGVIGLSRALIAAGTPSVLVSLWTVPDSSTAKLMIEFHKNFQQYPDQAVALRKAMLAVIQSEYSHPRNWAAFSLIGEAN
jgi:CHAT domain-containing protein